MSAPTENARYLGSVFVSNTCAAVAYAILSPALVANLAQWHTSAFLIAVITSIWALPNVVGGPLYTRLVARFNPRICLLVGMVASVTTLLLFPVFRVKDDTWEAIGGTRNLKEILELLREWVELQHK